MIVQKLFLLVMAYKQCIVPHCGNDTIKTPNKMFLNVPSNPIRKKQWFDKIAETFDVTYNRQLVQCHCCEDHFNVSFLLKRKE